MGGAVVGPAPGPLGGADAGQDMDEWTRCPRREHGILI
ncbi:hypothetical protein SAMN05444320_104279 [Streptoalloteichus hindustanus]|uniref:Uncharacterized protein n=1 Tax=Streptoalloteichus hindustanus TaxID=2017 RepID=A0A1M5D3E8_STRHI|nr:hypothetical protein SAMN05444320_104279 [Streptoalloteichus hindustanus]